MTNSQFSRQQVSQMMQADRRYQVFVSSTFRDLAEERKMAVEAIFNKGHIPIALEGFSPADSSDKEMIRQVISDCQIYILILGYRYGEIVPGMDISYTELEYNLAQENKLTTLVFILNESEVNDLRKTLDPNNERDCKELAHFSKLLEFQKRLRAHFWKPWAKTKENRFLYLVEKALNDNLPKCMKHGFVREPEEETMEIFRVAAQNEFIVDIVDQLKSFDKLYRRCIEHPAEKKALAKFFRRQYMDRILRHKVTLFFESGSTIAYLAKELAGPLSDGVKDGVKIDDSGRPSLQICTNNILAYLLLWLRAGVPCTVFPWGPPGEKTYGAAYGGLEKIEDQEPDYSLHPLDEIAKNEISKLIDLPYSPPTLHQPALLLSTASGLQMTDHLVLDFPDTLDQPTREKRRQQLRSCRGPHVGSYHNKVFKRFLYKTGIPLVMFLTGDKIDCKIEVGKCHFILDNEFNWEDFYKTHPLAFCIGCGQDNIDSLSAAFESLGFDIVQSAGSQQFCAFIARNAKFVELFERSTALKMTRPA